MAIDAYAGAFNIGLGAVASTVVVSGVGFQPKAIIFWWCGRTESADTVGRATHQRGMGFSSGATQNYATTSRSADATTPSACDRATRADACILEVSDGAYAGYADVQSVAGDGFTLEILDQFVTDLRVAFLALGGDAVESVAVGTFAENNVVGYQAATGVGFRPDVLVWASQNNNAGIPVLSTGSYFNMGMFAEGKVVGTPTAFAMFGAANDAAATTQSGRYLGTVLGVEGLVHAASAVGSPGQRSTIVGFTNDGFVYLILEAVNAYNDIYLAVGLASGYGAVVVRTSSSAGVDPWSVPNIGVAPSALLVMSHLTTQGAQDTLQDNDLWCVGAASGPSNRLAMAVRDEDAVASSTTVSTAVEHDAVYVNLSSTAVIGAADLQSFDPNGFTLIMDVPDAAANVIGVLALGEKIEGSALPERGVAVRPAIFAPGRGK